MAATDDKALELHAIYAVTPVTQVSKDVTLIEVDGLCQGNSARIH